MLFNYFNFSEQYIDIEYNWSHYDGRLDSVASNYSNNPMYQEMVPLTIHKAVVAYRRAASNDVIIRIVTVLDDAAPQWDPEVMVYVGSITALAVTVDPVSGLGVVVMRTDPNHYPKICVFKINTNESITVGTVVQAFAESFHYPALAMMDSQKVLWAFQSTRNNMGQCIIGTINSNTLTIAWGSRSNFETNAKPLYCQFIRLSTSQAMLVYQSGLAGNKTKAQIIQMSGLWLTQGGPVEVTSSAVTALKMVMAADNKVWIAYRHAAHAAGEVMVLTANNMAITVGTPIVFQQEPAGVAVVEIAVCIPESPYMLVNYTLSNQIWRTALIDMAAQTVINIVNHTQPPHNMDMLAVCRLSSKIVIIAARNQAVDNLGQMIKVKV